MLINFVIFVLTQVILNYALVNEILPDKWSLVKKILYTYNQLKTTRYKPITGPHKGEGVHLLFLFRGMEQILCHTKN